LLKYKGAQFDPYICDALLASASIDMNATLVTADQGFARFPGLRTRLIINP
jgi:predicted nucleic acid-binding protein